MADHFLCRTRVGKNVYLHDETVPDVVQCLLGLPMPLLPAHDIVGALQYIRITIATNRSHSGDAASATGGVDYVKRQWLDGRSVGPNRVCVRDNRARKTTSSKVTILACVGVFKLTTRTCSTS